MKNKNTITLVASIAVVFLVTMLIGTTASGVDTTITATVTAEIIALSITANSSFSYGSVVTTADTTSNGVDKSPTIKNDGSVNEDFQLKGTDSASWTLSPTAAGSATYMHKECHADCDTSPSWAALNHTSYSASIFTSVAPAGTNSFDLQVTVPTSNAGVSQQNVNVYVQATKS